MIMIDSNVVELSIYFADATVNGHIDTMIYTEFFYVVKA